MHVVIIILTVIVAILLICIVLVQKSKGGGLSSQFGGAGSVMGVRQTNSFLEKATWTLVGALAFLSVISAFTAPGRHNTSDLRTAPVQQEAPAAIPAPGQTETPVVVTEEEALTVEEVPAADAAAEQPAGE